MDELPSLLDLADRPRAYEDVGRLCRWGAVLPELSAADHRPATAPVARPVPVPPPATELAAKGGKGAPARPRVQARVSWAAARRSGVPEVVAAMAQPSSVTAHRELLPVLTRPSPRERRIRTGNGGVPKVAPERRTAERRRRKAAAPFPDRRLTRSAYEKVFLKLVSGDRLRIGRSMYTPVGMRGWFHAVFRRESDGKERLLSIDELLKRMDKWQP